MRTALIGLGRIGWRLHLKNIIQHKELELCAAVDTNTERLKELKENYGVAGYQDYKDMLKCEKPELVVIATPSVFHEEQAIAALKAGAHVILDKPMATDYEAAKRIRQTVLETKKKLVVYQSYRCSDAGTVAKRILARGILGPVFQIKCTDYDYVRRNDWQAFKEFGGGMLYNYTPHQLDMALHLSRGKVKRIFSSVCNVATLGDAEDVVRIMVETENGIILDVDINQASALSVPRLTIYGKYGTACLEKDVNGARGFRVKYFEPGELEIQKASRELELKERKYPSENIRWKEEWIPLKAEDYVDFYGIILEYFLGRAESPVALEESVELMRILEECKKSRK